MDAEYHQMMSERIDLLELALYNAQGGKATKDDWAIIRYECGLPALINQSGYKNVHSEIGKQQRV